MEKMKILNILKIKLNIPLIKVCQVASTPILRLPEMQFTSRVLLITQMGQKYKKFSVE